MLALLQRKGIDATAPFPAMRIIAAHRHEPSIDLPGDGREKETCRVPKLNSREPLAASISRGPAKSDELGKRSDRKMKDNIRKGNAKTLATNDVHENPGAGVLRAFKAPHRC